MTPLLLLLACAPPSDRELYLQALDVGGVEAGGLCAQIQDRSLQGECLSHAAATLVKGGHAEEGFRRCREILDPVWQEECWFLVADEAELLGEEARGACRHAGRFRAHCLGHAIGREVRDVETRFGKVGQEAALMQGITEVVARYKPGAPPDQRLTTVHTLMSRIIAAREAELPFDPVRCGEAPPELCDRAYRTSLDGTPREIDLEAPCHAELSREAVAEAGLRTWVEDQDGLGERVWTQLCYELETGQMRRGEKVQPGPPRPGRLPGDE